MCWIRGYNVVITWIVTKVGYLFECELINSPEKEYKNSLLFLVYYFLSYARGSLRSRSVLTKLLPTHAKVGVPRRVTASRRMKLLGCLVSGCILDSEHPV